MFDTILCPTPGEVPEVPACINGQALINKRYKANDAFSCLMEGLHDDMMALRICWKRLTFIDFHESMAGGTTD